MSEGCNKITYWKKETKSSRWYLFVINKCKELEFNGEMGKVSDQEAGDICFESLRPGTEIKDYYVKIWFNWEIEPYLTFHDSLEECINFVENFYDDPVLVGQVCDYRISKYGEVYCKTFENNDEFEKFEKECDAQKDLTIDSCGYFPRRFLSCKEKGNPETLWWTDEAIKALKFDIIPQ